MRLRAVAARATATAGSSDTTLISVELRLRKHTLKCHGDFHTLSQGFVWIKTLLSNQLAEFRVAYFRVAYFPATTPQRVKTEARRLSRAELFVAGLGNWSEPTARRARSGEKSRHLRLEIPKQGRWQRRRWSKTYQEASAPYFDTLWYFLISLTPTPPFCSLPV